MEVIRTVLKIAGEVTDAVFSGARSSKERQGEVNYVSEWSASPELRPLLDGFEVSDEAGTNCLNAATQTFGDDAFKLFSSVAKMTNLILSSVKAEEFERFEERTSWILERDVALTDCEAGFNRLYEEEEEHYQSECAYGFACLRAIEGNSQEALLHLQNALKWIEPSRVFHQRAELDEDLDSIRETAEFKKLLYESDRSIATATSNSLDTNSPSQS